MQRQAMVHVVRRTARRIEHSQQAFGRLAEAAAVQETADAPEHVSQRQSGGDNIQHPPHVKLVFAAVYNNAQHCQEKTAVKNQSAAVDAEYLQQIVFVGVPELDNIGDSRSDDAGEYPDEYQRCRLIGSFSNFAVIADCETAARKPIAAMIRTIYGQRPISKNIGCIVSPF
jgi:hypothetical protein